MKKLFLLLVIISAGMLQTYARPLTQAEKDSLAVCLSALDSVSTEFDSISKDVATVKTLTGEVQKDLSNLKKDLNSLLIKSLVALGMILLSLFFFFRWIFSLLIVSQSKKSKKTNESWIKRGVNTPLFLLSKIYFQLKIYGCYLDNSFVTLWLIRITSQTPGSLRRAVCILR